MSKSWSTDSGVTRAGRAIATKNASGVLRACNAAQAIFSKPRADRPRQTACASSRAGRPATRVRISGEVRRRRRRSLAEAAAKLAGDGGEISPETKVLQARNAAPYAGSMKLNGETRENPAFTLPEASR
jgi:hypothetical protein